MLIHGGFAPPASWEPEDSRLSQVKAFPERRGGFSFKYPSLRSGGWCDEGRIPSFPGAAGREKNDGSVC